jgi:transposase
MAAVAITRDEHSAADLRREAARTKDADAARRRLALALVQEGWSRAEAAQTCGMDRQTLRDWVHRSNADGRAGLADRPHPGRPSRLTADQMKQLEAVVEKGPDPQTDGVVRWRRIDLAAVITKRFAVTVHERTVGQWRHQLNLAKLSVRPQHPESVPEAQEAFKKTLPHT